MRVSAKFYDDFVDDLFDNVVDEMTVGKLSLDSPEVYEKDTLPVGIVEFAESDEFLQLHGKLYKQIKPILEDIEQPEIREVDLILGKGSGKSMIAQIFTLYGAYQVLKMKNPQSFFELTPNTGIYSINVSISLSQAKDVIFEGIKYMVENSPFFSNISDIGAQSISLPKESTIMCGHSNSTAFLGYPTLRGVLDEANYMINNQNRNVAQQLYTALRGSMKTRFPKNYKILCISSDSTPTSFLRSRLRQIKKDLNQLSLEDLNTN